jgi:hypothetical protein
MRRLTKITAIGLTGWLGGILTERYRSQGGGGEGQGLVPGDGRLYCTSAPNSNSPIFNIPSIGRVHAASKIPREEGSGVLPFTDPDLPDSKWLWGPDEQKQNRTAQVKICTHHSYAW